jgi:hypothetical protein
MEENASSIYKSNILHQISSVFQAAMLLFAVVAKDIWIFTKKIKLHLPLIGVAIKVIINCIRYAPTMREKFWMA